MSIEGKIKPDVHFCIALYEESINISSERIVKYCDTLKTLIKWVFTIFASDGFILTFFAANFKSYNPLTLILLGTALFLLTIVQVVIAKVKAPVTKTYNPNDPAEIESILSQKTRIQARVFTMTMDITFTTFFLLALVILILFWSLTKKEAEKTAAALIASAGFKTREKQPGLLLTIMQKSPWRFL